MSVAYTEIAKPFVGALQEDTDKRLLEDGFTTIENGEFTKTGRVSKRPGLEEIVDSLAGSTDGIRITAHDDTLIVTQPIGLRSHYYTAKLGRMDVGDSIPEATVRTRGIQHDMAASLLRAQMTVCNGYAFYVWETYDSSNTTLRYLIKEIATDSVRLQGSLGSQRFKPVVAPNSTSNTIALLYSSASTALYARLIDVSGTTPSVGIETTLLASTLHSQRSYDLVEAEGGPHWWIGYVSTSGDGIFHLLTSGLGFTSLYTTTDTTLTRVALTVIDGSIFCAWQETATSTVKYTAIAGLGETPLAETTILTGISSVSGPLSIGRLTDTACIVSIFSSAVFYVRSGDNAGTLAPASAANWIRDAIGESKIFTANGRPYQWIMTRWGGEYSTLVLMHLTIGATEPAQSRLISTAGFGRPKPATARDLPSHVGAESSNVFHFAPQLRYLSGSGLIGVDDIEASFEDPNRHQPQRFGKHTYFSGGYVAQFDAWQMPENGFVQVPALSVSAGSSASGPTAGQVYTYVLVYEWVDAAGHVHRSTPSDPQTVTPVDNGGGVGSVNLSIGPCNITRKDEVHTTSVERPSILLAIYRSIGDGAVLYRLHAIDAHPIGLINNVSIISDYAYEDTVADSAHTANPTLYTTGGVLENDHVYGGCTTICLHKNRLWAAGGEDETELWYSQEFVGGEPAQFNITQKHYVPGDSVNLLMSLDDALIAFSPSRIYAILGDGPNALGDPSSGYFALPQLISSDSGCTFPRAAVLTPDGVMFVGRQGIYLLNRSRQVQYISAPVEDTIATYPTFQSATYVPDRGEVRWIVTDGTNARTIVYDRTAGKWAVWKHLGGDDLADATMYKNKYTVLRATGLVYQETADSWDDDGAWYGLVIETGQMSFGGWQGQKRLKRFRLMLEQLGVGGVAVDVARDGAAYTGLYSFTGAEIAAATSGSVRGHMTLQRGHRWQFRVREAQSATDSHGLAFTGLAFEVATEGGLQRNVAAESK